MMINRILTLYQRRKSREQVLEAQKCADSFVKRVLVEYHLENLGLGDLDNPNHTSLGAKK